MAEIKAKLAVANPAVAPPSYTAEEVLSKLDRGEIGHAEAVRLLRAAARGEKQGGTIKSHRELGGSTMLPQDGEI
jgi:hypothetical protein